VSIEPAMGALLGLVFLDEHLTAYQSLAIAAVIIASIGGVFSARNATVQIVEIPEPAPVTRGVEPQNRNTINRISVKWRVETAQAGSQQTANGV
jgi:hypothetical protein